MSSPAGKLYGVGVGPGDPELLTLKAVRVLGSVEILFAACSKKNGRSIALEIVRPHLPAAAKVERLPFPMSNDPQAKWRAAEENARRVVKALAGGREAAFLTLGDPLTYSTFVYLLSALQRNHPEVEVEVVPGVTSYSAAAALAAVPLAHGEESLLILSGAQGAARLREQAHLAENIVILKVYRQFEAIKAAAEELGLDREAVLVSQAGLDGQRVVTRLADQKGTPPYLSLVIAKVRPGGNDSSPGA